MKDFDRVEILLVEDNKNDRQLILRVLKSHNLDDRVFVVKDGEEALEYIFATGRYKNRSIFVFPKLIILDLKIPKVTGLEVLKRTRSDMRTKLLPVVIFTSSLEEKEKLESHRLGTNSFVVKPISYEKFVQAVSQLGLYWLDLNQPAYS